MSITHAYILHTVQFSSVGTTDFQAIPPRTLALTPTNPTTTFQLFANNDEITLEFEDKVQLMFTPAEGVISALESINECIITTAIVCIIDNDRKCVCGTIFCYSLLFLSPALEINFVESDYSIMEGSDTLSSTISLQFRENQKPFMIKLSPTTVDAAEVKYNLSEFINSDTITADSRATLGILVKKNFQI